MTGDNSTNAQQRYVQRMTKIYGEIASLTEDLKQIALEAKAEGLDSAPLKRWARAIATDKARDLAQNTIAILTAGEAVAPDLFADRETGELPVDPPRAADGRTH